MSDGSLAAVRHRFRRGFAERFFVRFHLSLILLGVVAAGVAANKILLLVGLPSMLWRYLLAVLLSYLVFLALLRLWTQYLASGSAPPRRHRSTDVGEFPSSRAEGIDDGFRGGGGEFGGAGASGGFDAGGTTEVATGASSFVDGDDVIALAFGLLLAVVMGVALFFIYLSPALLLEAAFQLLLASGLLRSSKEMEWSGWTAGVLRATAIPLVMVLIVAGAIGWVAESTCPQATKLAEVLRACLLR